MSNSDTDTQKNKAEPQPNRADSAGTIRMRQLELPDQDALVHLYRVASKEKNDQFAQMALSALQSSLKAELSADEARRLAMLIDDL